MLPQEVGLHRSFVEIDTDVLTHNMATIRGGLAKGARLAAVVKSNAYGHDYRLAWKAFVKGGADWLCVDSLHEAADLRADGCDRDIFVMGHIPPQHAESVVELGVHAMTYLPSQVEALGAASNRASKIVRLIMKLETGTQRQGLTLQQAIELAQLASRYPYLKFEGVCTHFANIEDTVDHSFAYEQLRTFNAYVKALEAAGYTGLMRTIANSAAAILWPDTHMELVRAGITCYGMWPSAECRVSAMLLNKEIALRPAMTWKTTVAQVKDVPVGEHIGYGCTYMTTHASKIVVLPVGYYDGYDRALSNLAYVLIHGRRAPIRGRICMNMCMADVTDIDGVQPGDEVVLLGRQGKECISAELLGSWSNTINYEVTTQIQTAVPRIAKT